MCNYMITTVSIASTKAIAQNAMLRHKTQMIFASCKHAPSRNAEKAGRRHGAYREIHSTKAV